jgi:hypothetical protein
MDPPRGPRFDTQKYAVGSANVDGDWDYARASGAGWDRSHTPWRVANGKWESTVRLRCSDDDQCSFSSERGTRDVVCTKIEKSFRDDDVSRNVQARFENVWGFVITQRIEDLVEWRDVQIVLNRGISMSKESELIWSTKPMNLQHGSMGSFQNWAMERGFEVIFEKGLTDRTRWKCLPP